MTPICPKCGEQAVLTTTKWGPRHDHCGLWSWDSAPLVDADTHEARKRAHEAFDQVWQAGRVSRSTAYKMLADELGIEPKDCHIKLMSAEVASRVPELAQKIIGYFGGDK